MCRVRKREAKKSKQRAIFTYTQFPDIDLGLFSSILFFFSSIFLLIFFNEFQKCLVISELTINSELKVEKQNEKVKKVIEAVFICACVGDLKTRIRSGKVGVKTKRMVTNITTNSIFSTQLFSVCMRLNVRVCFDFTILSTDTYVLMNLKRFR